MWIDPSVIFMDTSRLVRKSKTTLRLQFDDHWTPLCNPTPEARYLARPSLVGGTSCYTLGLRVNLVSVRIIVSETGGVDWRKYVHGQRIFFLGR